MPPLYAQPVFHMLVNIISAKACPELENVDDILRLEVPPGPISYRVFEWSDDGEKKSVFPTWARNGQKDKQKSPMVWGNQFSAWATRVGIPGGLGFHSIRREALIQANGSYPPLNRLSL